MDESDFRELHHFETELENERLRAENERLRAQLWRRQPEDVDELEPPC